MPGGLQRRERMVMPDPLTPDRLMHHMRASCKNIGPRPSEPETLSCAARFTWELLQTIDPG